MSTLPSSSSLLSRPSTYVTKRKREEKGEEAGDQDRSSGGSSLKAESTPPIETILKRIKELEVISAEREAVRASKEAEEKRRLKRIDFLCRFESSSEFKELEGKEEKFEDGSEAIFSMPELRVLALSPGRSMESLWKASRRELCSSLGYANRVAKWHIPYKEIRAVDVSVAPNWGWDPIENALLSDPYCASSARSYSRAIKEPLTKLGKDPTNKRRITAEWQRNEKLEKAIDAWIFTNTGFTLEELEDAEGRDLLVSAKTPEERRGALQKILMAYPRNSSALEKYVAILIGKGAKQEAK